MQRWETRANHFITRMFAFEESFSFFGRKTFQLIHQSSDFLFELELRTIKMQILQFQSFSRWICEKSNRNLESRIKFSWWAPGGKVRMGNYSIEAIELMLTIWKALDSLSSRVERGGGESKMHRHQVLISSAFVITESPWHNQIAFQRFSFHLFASLRVINCNSLRGSDELLCPSKHRRATSHTPKRLWKALCWLESFSSLSSTGKSTLLSRNFFFLCRNT